MTFQIIANDKGTARIVARCENMKGITDSSNNNNNNNNNANGEMDRMNKN